METSFTSFNWVSLIVVPGILLGYTIHELGHILMAYYLGDDSQVERQKITLNPLSHISWFGALAFIFIGIGWPKIMQVNPHKLKRQHRDMFLVAIAGPIASLTVALLGGLITLTLAAILIYLSGTSTNEVMVLFFPLTTEAFPQTLNLQALLMAFSAYIATTSLILTFMSLLPFPGQDGFIALASLIAMFRTQSTPHPAAPVISPIEPPRQLMTNPHQRKNHIAEIHFNIGLEYHTEEKFEDAIARYRQTIANDKHFGPAYVNMGLAYLAKDEPDKAIQSLRGATQFADDEESKLYAWQHLQSLTQNVPLALDDGQLGADGASLASQSEAKAEPDWMGIAISSGLLLLAGLLLYSYLIDQFVKRLTS